MSRINVAEDTRNTGRQGRLRHATVGKGLGHDLTYIIILGWLLGTPFDWTGAEIQHLLGLGAFDPGAGVNVLAVLHGEEGLVGRAFEVRCRSNFHERSALLEGHLTGFGLEGAPHPSFDKVSGAGLPTQGMAMMAALG